MQRAGALVDVMDALPGALRDRGHEISVALPFYREIRENRAFKKKDTGITVDVQVGDTTHVARYLEGRSASGVQLFFIRCDDFFDRPGIYGERGKPYDDNAARFIFFLQSNRRAGPAIDTAIGDFAFARLGAGVGARFCACTRSAFQHGFDHPSRR